MTRIKNADCLAITGTVSSVILKTPMHSDIENYFLDPPADSAAARAAQFGIDLTLTLGNLRLTPEERIRKLDSFIEGVAKLKTLTRLKGPTNATSEQDH